MGEWVIVSEPVVYGLDAAPPVYAKRFYSFKINELIDLESWYLKKWFSNCKTWLDVVAKVIKEIKYPLDCFGRPTDYHYLQCFRKYPAKCYRTYKIDADFWLKASETAFYKMGDCEDSSVLCGAGHDLLGYMYWIEFGIVKKRGQVLGGHAWEISVDDSKTWRLVESTLDKVPRKFPVVDPDSYVHKVGELEYEAFIRFDSAFCEVRKDLVKYVNDGGDIVGEPEFHMCLNCYVTYRKATKKREKKKLKVIRESWREAGFV